MAMPAFLKPVAVFADSGYNRFVTDIPRPSLTLVTDRNLYRTEAGGAANPLSLIEAAITGGVDTVQLRIRNAETDDLGAFAVAMRLREMTADKVRFIMTGDIQLAEKCHADGLLLPERSYKPSEARQFLRGGSRLVGAFVQSVEGASRAERGGADYVHVGPAFSEEVDSTPEGGAVERYALPDNGGLTLIRKIKDAVHIPVIAFGGIAGVEQVEECVRAGADGVAVTDAITKADDPAAAASLLRAALHAAWQAVHGDAGLPPPSTGA